MSNQTAAIIMASGFGGRFLPISKSINKCMMPVLNKPVLQYRVEECIHAGIDKIYITAPMWDTQITEYFSHDNRLEGLLSKTNKVDLYQQHVVPLESYIDKIEVIKVPHDTKVGTAIPPSYVLKQLDQAIKRVVIMNGDDMIARQDGVIGELKIALDNHQNSTNPLLIGFKVSLEERHKYGVLIQNQANPSQLDELVEKPEASFRPDCLIANHGCYVLPRSIERYIELIEPNQASGEYYLTDAVGMLAQDQTSYIHIAEGTFLDFGQPATWLTSNNAIASILEQN